MCTDDKGVFNCDLSHELRTAAEAFGWSHETLYNLEYQALSYTFCGENERGKLLSWWETWRLENEHYFKPTDPIITEDQRSDPVITEDQRLLLAKQDTRLVTEFKAKKLEAEAQKNWDLFYKRNGIRNFVLCHT